MRRAVVGLVSAVVLTGCAGTPTPQALGPGGELCYRFEENGAADALGLPHGLLLAGDGTSGPPGSDGRRSAATLLADGRRSEVPFAAWSSLAGDSIQVGPLFTGSLQLRLVPSELGLQGLGRFIGDIARPGQEAPSPVDGVVAESVACVPPR